MTVPLAKIDIVAIAAGLLGEQPVDSIDAPSTKEEKGWARTYDLVREDLLRSHNWNFAKRLKTVTRSGTPDHTWEDKYSLPDDYLRLICISGREISKPEKWLDIFGREIYFDNGGGNSIDIEYIANVTDLSLWDANARMAFAKYLAKEMVFYYDKNNRTVERLNNEYLMQLKLAISTDTVERPPLLRTDSKIKNKRRFYTGSGVVASDREDWVG